MSRKKFVFDTYAVLALVEDEPGAETVAEIITDEEAEAYLSVISLGETYYILFRKKGEQVAKEVTQNIMMEESLSLVDAPWPRVIEAARTKAKGGLSYADSFVLGLAQELRAPIVTGDPEIRMIAQKLEVEIIWIAHQKND